MLIFYLLLLIAMVLNVDSNGNCGVNEMVTGTGYPLDTYDVVTEDGYILELHRIQGKNQTQAKKPIIFLMHGLFASAYTFVALGPKYAIAFNLADAGFDVWLGNARGVCNSRRHTKLNPDTQKTTFFNYSWEEIALYDIPVMIDFALNKSGQQKLHYIGHSQGGCTFLVLNSMKPEYSEKIMSAHLLAGVGYQNHFPNEKMRKYSALTNVFYRMSRAVRFVEVKYKWIGSNKNITTEVGEEKVPLSKLGTSASLKQMSHFGQNIKDQKFRRWDYSSVENLNRYGTVSPPEYDITKINVDITMHYTIADVFLDERDVLAMVKDLPNARARKIEKENFTHYDFVQSSFVKALVTDYIIKDIKEREERKRPSL